MSDYSEFEEKINVNSHILGIFLGFIELVLLSIKAAQAESFAVGMSYIIFGVSIVVLYYCSVRYHGAKNIVERSKMKVLDHCAIYVLIAGSYAPYALAAIGGKLGWIIFGVSWFFALIGITLKLFFTGQFKIISTLMYVFMGWMIMFFIKPLMNALPAEGLYWLAAGGLSYTLGAILYSIKKIHLNHAIFHVLVVIGTLCHFISIYLYI